MAAVQRLQKRFGQDQNGNNSNKGDKKRSTRTAKAAATALSSSSSDSEGDSDHTVIGYPMSAMNFADALEDVKTSINESVSSKLDSVFEKTKKYMDKTIKPIATRLEKVEKKAAATEEFAQKSVKDILDNHKNIWTSIDQIKKQGTDKRTKPSYNDNLQKQYNLLIQGLELEEGETIIEKVTKLLDDLNVEISGKFNARKIPGDRILIEFNSCWDKRAAYKARTRLRSHDYEGVFINEDLTEEQADLFYIARAAKKQKLIKSAWTMNGATYISKTVRGEQEMQEIASKEHLKLLLPKLKIPKAKKAATTKAPKAWSKQEHEPSDKEDEAPKAKTKDSGNPKAGTSRNSSEAQENKEDGEVSS